MNSARREPQGLTTGSNDQFKKKTEQSEPTYPSKFDSAAFDRLRPEHVEGSSSQAAVQYSAVRLF